MASAAGDIFDERDHAEGRVRELEAELERLRDATVIVECDQDKYVAMTYEQPEVIQAFAVLRRHLPESLRAQEAELEAAWFNGGPLPIDWPGRLRAAAEAAEREGSQDASWLLGHLAEMSTGYLPAHVVAAVGRELLGQES